MKAVLFMKKLNIKTKRIAQLLPISKSTIYRRTKVEKQEKQELHSNSPKSSSFNNLLKQRINQIALKYPFYGYRRIYVLLRREGITVNHKKVYRIYKELNLQRPKKKKKRRRGLIESIPALKLTKHIYPNAVWVTDFVHDSLINNRTLIILIIQDAYTKKVVGYRIDRSITAEDVLDTFKKAISVYGRPHILRSDNGPGFRSQLLNSFLNTNRIIHEFIEKGKPYQNGIAESFMDKLRDECLNLNMFKNIEEAREVIKNYINFYNSERPHSSLNYRTPIEFERSLAII
jgi:putative transposase